MLCTILYYKGYTVHSGDLNSCLINLLRVFLCYNISKIESVFYIQLCVNKVNIDIDHLEVEVSTIVYLYDIYIYVCQRT